MYRRYLNNNDYISLVSEGVMEQLTRGNEDCIPIAEEAAEASIVEYLSEGYDIEKVLNAGKNILQHNTQVTYPAGVFFYFGDKIVKTLRTINGCKRPSVKQFWEEYGDIYPDDTPLYSQCETYSPGDIVIFSGIVYICLEYNGFDFNDIRIPNLVGWQEVPYTVWQPNFTREPWEVVEYEGYFYAMIGKGEVDLTLNPVVSDDWGLIGNYDQEYNQYENSDTEYVVFGGRVFAPTMNVNADSVYDGVNVKPEDPRHANVKKHMLRMAVYELHKLVSPAHVSQIRITDYESSIQWLRDAARMRINPQLPRKEDNKGRPRTEWQLATFSANYNPYENPWHV